MELGLTPWNGLALMPPGCNCLDITLEGKETDPWTGKDWIKGFTIVRLPWGEGNVPDMVLTGKLETAMVGLWE
jgi:hypothetical protein